MTLSCISLLISARQVGHAILLKPTFRARFHPGVGVFELEQGKFRKFSSRIIDTAMLAISTKL